MKSYLKLLPLIVIFTTTAYSDKARGKKNITDNCELVLTQTTEARMKFNALEKYSEGWGYKTIENANTVEFPLNVPGDFLVLCHC